MGSFGVRISGDWALQPQGAITINGAEAITISHNLFSRLDGNAIFIGGYVRNLTIQDNEFEYIGRTSTKYLSWSLPPHCALGDSVMASWGLTSTNLNANGSISVQSKVGPDGRGGEQPRGTKVLGNIVREIGLWQKQSSLWFQVLSCHLCFTCI